MTEHQTEKAQPGSTHADLVEAGWIDVATLRAKTEQARAEARVDALSDLLTEIEDDPIRWQRGGGASTGALVVTNIVKRRLSEGPRQHAVTWEGDGFWRCSCTPGKLRPVDHDPSHRTRALSDNPTPPATTCNKPFSNGDSCDLPEGHDA